MKLFDSHCHLHFPQFDPDREAVLQKMEEKGVGAVVIGTDYKTSVAALDLAKQHDFLWASVGLHPNDNKDEQFDIANYEALARNKKVVAIGECGLDYFRSGGSEEERTAQKEKFLAQAALAKRVGKALIIHCRNAHDDMLLLLAERQLEVPVVIHFFTGSGALAQRYLDLGCHLSFPGPVTYTTEYDDSIRVCPMNSLLIETDAPFAAPVPHRGTRNEPLFVEHVAEKVAQIKGISAEEVAARSAQNARKVFCLG